MNKDTRYWASLSINGIKDAMAKMPNKVKDSEQYGKQVMANVKVWDDGTASISVYNAETKERINLGKILISKDQNEVAAPAPASNFDDNAPF